MNCSLDTSCHQLAGWTLHDAVHGPVQYPGYVRAIVDTPEFQRLRNLKQLGTSSKVFPCATHTRFEHCLGVCHLAGKLLETLERNSPRVQISDIHRKCVTVAALLHDIGHGPFSHMWEDFVHAGSDKQWTHEQSSCEMARQLFANNGIQLSQGYEHFYAEQLVCALITGNQEALKTLLTPDTMFLAEIVHNKRFKLDVDKWDYLLRDLFYLRGAIDVDSDFVELFEHARVVRDVEGVTHIGYRARDYRRIVQLFEARAKLHMECYQHPIILGLEKLLIDALTQAEENGFRLKGTKISEAHQTPLVYQFLDDSVINLIETNESTKLQEVQQTLGRIRSRQLYSRVHESNEPCDIDELNKRFGTDAFFQVHKRIPYGSEMAPRNVPLFDESGDLVDSSAVVDEVMSTIAEKGHFEQFLVYCKSTGQDVISSAREYLENGTVSR